MATTLETCAPPIAAGEDRRLVPPQRAPRGPPAPAAPRGGPEAPSGAPDRISARAAPPRRGQRRSGQGTGGDDTGPPLFRRKPGDLLAHHGDVGMLREGSGDGRGKAVPVDGQRPTRRNLMGIGGLHDQRTQAAHLLMQQPHGVAVGIVRPEGIGADEFRQPVASVGFGATDRPHLMDHGAMPGLRDLPGGFGPGETAADDVNGVRHARK